MQEQRAQGGAAVADHDLTLRGGFAERAFERRIVEQRIVAESVRPARLFQNLPFDRAAKCAEQAPAIGQRNHANESRGAAANAAQARNVRGIRTIF